MPEKSSSPWIIVAVVALVVACCCALAAAAAAGGLLWFMPLQRLEAPGCGGERFEQSFDVGQTPHLDIDNFAGSVLVQAGDGRNVRVVVTKQAGLGSDLDRIEVHITERDGGLSIRTKKPGTMSNASVRIEIMAPTGTRLDAHTGAGSIEVRGLRGGVQVDTGAGSVSLTDLGDSAAVHTGSGSVQIQGLNGDLEVDTGSGSVALDGVTGDIEAHTGSGGVDVQRATGQVRLDTGTGGINYQGTPQGDCRFETGSGGGWGLNYSQQQPLATMIDATTAAHGSRSVRLPLPLVSKYLTSPVFHVRENRDYTISAGTRDILAALDDQVFLYGYFSRETHPKLAPLVPRIGDMLDEYRLYGGGKVVVRVVDPREDEAAEKEAFERFGVKATPFRLLTKYESAVKSAYFVRIIYFQQRPQWVLFFPRHLTNSAECTCPLRSLIFSALIAK